LGAKPQNPANTKRSMFVRVTRLGLTLQDIELMPKDQDLGVQCML